MSPSIARFLKDFGEPEVPASSAAPSLETVMSSFDDFPMEEFPAAAPEPVVDIAAVEAAAVERGRSMEREALSARFEQEKQALIEQHEAALKAEAEKLENEIAQRLAGNITQGLEQIVTFFGDQVMVALAPVITEELARKASGELAEVVRQSLLDGEASKLVIKGPKPMFDAFIAVLGLEETHYQFTESSDHDLTVEMGESVVVTRMSAWASSLRKVMQ